MGKKRFTNKLTGAVSSAGFGEQRLSSYPGGSTKKLSGTSMASPENMLLYTYLVSMDPSMSTVDALNILKRGIVREETFKTEVESGGVTVPSRVYLEFLLYQAKKLGYFSDLNFAPLLHVLPGRLKEAASFLEGVSLKEKNLDAEDAVGISDSAIKVLEEFLDAVKAGSQVDPVKTRQTLDTINRSQVLAQAHLLDYFVTPKQKFEILRKHGIDTIEQKENFDAFYRRVILPDLNAAQFQNTHLVRIVEFCKHNPEMKIEDLNLLYLSLVSFKVKRQYIRTLFFRIKEVKPDFAPEIEKLEL